MSHALGSVEGAVSKGYHDIIDQGSRAIHQLGQNLGNAGPLKYIFPTSIGSSDIAYRHPKETAAALALAAGDPQAVSTLGGTIGAPTATATEAGATDLPALGGAPGATPGLVGDANLPALSPSTLSTSGGFGTIPDLPAGSTTLLNSAAAAPATSSPSLLATLGKYGVPAALAGYNVYQSRQQPQLPQQLQQVSGIASQDAQLAQQIIQSGGTASPMWGNQKQSIDAQINQNIQQARQQLLQTAANTGMGTNSMVVQQQIQQMQQQFEMQRQQLYQQAQQQNVSNATSLLSGSNASLTSIGETQLKQDDAARQQLAQGLALIGQMAGNL